MKQNVSCVNFLMCLMFLSDTIRHVVSFRRYFKDSIITTSPISLIVPSL